VYNGDNLIWWLFASLCEEASESIVDGEAGEEWVMGTKYAKRISVGVVEDGLNNPGLL
jgi:hypothetical protein